MTLIIHSFLYSTLTNIDSLFYHSWNHWLFDHWLTDTRWLIKHHSPTHSLIQLFIASPSFNNHLINHSFTASFIDSHLGHSINHRHIFWAKGRSYTLTNIEPLVAHEIMIIRYPLFTSKFIDSLTKLLIHWSLSDSDIDSLANQSLNFTLTQ